MKINPVNTSFTNKPSFLKKSGQKQPKYEVSLDVNINEKQGSIMCGECSFENVKNMAKTNLWLCTNPPTKRTMKAIVFDPKAYFFELKRPAWGKVVSNNVIGTVSIKNRKTKKEEMLDIQCVEFEDSTAIYALNKGKEKLAFVDIDTIDEGAININYLSTVVGREDYRGLFLSLMQVLIEDSINTKGIIPVLKAKPAEVGHNSFNRKTLYGFYGAETQIVDGEFCSEQISVVQRERIVQMLEGVQNSKHRKFIFPETEANFNKLKNDL